MTKKKRQKRPRKGKAATLSKPALARLVELARAGLPQRQIAEVLAEERLADISQSTVSRLLREMDAEGEDVGRTLAPVEAVPAPKSDSGEQEGDSDGDDSRTPLERLDDRLAEIDAMIEAAKERGNVNVFATLAKLSADLLKRRADLTPPTPPNPEDDPANEKARERVRQLRDRLLAARDREAAALLKKCCDDCRDLVGPWLGVDPATGKSTDPRGDR